MGVEDNLNLIRQPMILKPQGKDYLWGGEKLISEYGKMNGLHPLAETWECSVHPDGLSVIDSGIFKGMTLKAVLGRHPEFMGTKAALESTFPIMVKLIDAKQDLSVQVHPSDEYARKYENGQNGKTEFWYVMEAEPGARLACGFAHNVTEEQLKHGIETGTLSKHLQYVPVHRGDVFFIPAGTVHAIGAGIVLAEVQESSNLTYRLFDYNRLDPKTGAKRTLHFEKAIKVLNMKAGAEIRQKPNKVDYTPGCSREVLIRCEYFEAERIVSSLGFEFSVMNTSFQIILCLTGYGGIKTDHMSKPLRFHKGDCIFLAADCGRCHVIGQTEVLKVRC